MTDATKPAGFYADFAGFAALKKSASQQDPQALREAARQFESIFTQMMLKSMRSASQAGSSGSMMDSDQSNFYRDMYDGQLAVQMSKGKGLGLADLLVRQLGHLNGAGNAHAPAKVNGPATSSTAKPLLYPMPPAATTSSVSANSTINSTTDVAPNVGKPFVANTASTVSSDWRSDAKPVEHTDVSSDGANAAYDAPSARNAQIELSKAGLSVANPADFVRQMWPHAEAAARELGVDPHTLLAHAALETGWGRFIPCDAEGGCSYNLFGIKAGGKWNGSTVGVNSLEYEGGVAVTRNSSFRAYGSPAESFRDYATLLKSNPRYATALNTGADAAAFGAALQRGGYATDPNYANKLAATAASLQAITRQSALKSANFGPLTLGRGAT
jgi:peptidoglycan hydrolase FlgJ